MSDLSTQMSLDACGCCKAGSEAPSHVNPPGQSVIDYRIGTHPDLLSRMTARIHAWEILICASCSARFVGPSRLDAVLDHIAKAHPDAPNPADLVRAVRPLAELGTRAPDDPAIALMDAWAVAGDVLAFYQERIANETYLRTATERRSILELARAIGYELDPGVAAEAYVAFTVDDAEGAPFRAEVPAGTQLMSIPASPDEVPQTFETDTGLTAQRNWNALRPRQAHPHGLTTDLSHLFLDGLSTGLEAGDRLLLLLDGSPYVRQVQVVTPNTDAGWTRVDFTTGSAAPSTALPMQPGGALDPSQEPLPLSRDHVEAEIVAQSWAESDLQALLAQHEWEADDVLAYVDDLRAATFTGGTDQVLALRARAAVFGHSAMDWKALPDDVKADYLGLDDPNNLTAEDKAAWPDYVIFSPTDAERPVAESIPVQTVVTAQQMHDAVQGALGEVTSAAFGSASSAGATAAASAALVAQRAVEATEQAAVAVQQIVSDTSGEVANLASSAIDTFWNPETATGPEIRDAISEARTVIKQLVEEADELPPVNEIVAEVLQRAAIPPDDNSGANPAETYLGALFSDLATGVRDSSTLDETLAAIATKMSTFAQSTVTEVGDLAEGITASIVAAAAPALDAIRASTVAHTQATVGAVGKAAEAAGSAAASSVVSAAVRAALSDPNATPESVADIAQRFADAGVAVLEAYEGPLPNTAQQAIDSGIGQQIAGTIASAQQVVEAVRIASVAEETLETVEGFVELAQAPRVGGASVRDAVRAAIDRVESATHDVFRRAFPERYTDTLDLDRVYKSVLPDSWALLTRPGDELPFLITAVEEAARAEYGLSAKTTRITLDDPAGDLEAFRDLVRETTVHVDSEALPLAAVPITAHLGAGTKSLWLGTMVLGLVEGQVVALQGEEVDADGAVRDEFLTLDAITHRAGYTQLMFEEGIARNYRRDTVTINANVVRARHGETVDSEVLGSGNGAVMHQRFKLKKSPLTHRSAVGGSESELTVRVDGVAWTPVDTLYEQSATDRSYLVQIDNDASATVVFGDGEHGARLPTGSENVTATYRSGIGSAGEVGAGTLTLLKTRPFGIRAVTNPLPASGADDPELLDDARANAPLTVLTLDRIVSLQDYEDYARAYPGIGKARADLVWNGEAEVVHLTVATASGDAVVEPLYSRLVDSIEAARDPLRAVHVDMFRSFVFFVTATVRIDPAYRWEDIEAALRAALTEAFGFEARAFGQPVTAADVVQVMHDEDGVMAVDLDALYKTAPDAAAPTGSLFNAVLPSQTAHFDAVSGTLAPAELLQIQPLGITLTEMNP